MASELNCVSPAVSISLAEGIVRLLDDSGPYTKTREEISRVFSLERTVDRYETLLTELAGVPVAQEGGAVA